MKIVIWEHLEAQGSSRLSSESEYYGGVVVRASDYDTIND